MLMGKRHFFYCWPVLFLLRFLYSLEGDVQQLKQQSPGCAEDIQHDDDLDVFFRVTVCTEQYEEADACADQKAGHHLTGCDHSVKVQLCNGYGGAAVGNQADQRCQKDADDLSPGKKGSDIGFADIFDNDSENQGNDENEEGDMDRMNEGGEEDTAFFIFAMAVLGFTKVVYALLRLVFVFCKAQEEVDGDARDDADDGLGGYDLQDCIHVCLARNQQRQHFIAGRKEDGNQCSDCQKSSGIQRCGGGREAALRNHAYDASEERSKSADF